MALHKVMIMGRDSSTTKEDYITVNSHKLAVDVGTTPDTDAGDFASIAADIATVKADIALMKADLAAILAILES